MEEIETTAVSRRKGPGVNLRGATGPIKRLFPTGGPFGGNDLLSVFGNNNIPSNNGKPTAIGGVADSDSSDDDLRKPANSSALDHRPSVSRGKNSLSDSDPLGIDVNIDFSAVGGLDHYINQLKEMVYLPLMYPEVYKRFNITPPRGVLFHGPPGTGKTLMARALASSFSSQDRKVTFFMRKGADCLSKWVGEAERQLRLLFEEAKNKQPSIIFFDEIDGLAPVRSSKQEQIHASIVSTLLALMDGMDNRGQVIVIGATNRPDAIDPALRRPGRFDREFYFPLPDLDARKQIITIQTRKWDPPLDPRFVEHIAYVTKGYGGADLRALCTEAALSAIQTRYPQIYQSTKKLLIDPSTIQISPRDFLRAVDRIIPSSARSTSSLAAPLPKNIEPLLSDCLEQIRAKLNRMVPRNKKLSPLEEALYEDDTALPDGVSTTAGFAKQEALKEFQTSRVFRPRLLIHGGPGMGQQYLASATLHHLEEYHVQSFDLGTLFSDSTRTPEAAIIQLLVEVKRHTPSVIFIPNIDTWVASLSAAAISTFSAFLRNLNPTDAVLVLGMLETSDDLATIDPAIQSLFGYSSENLQSIHGVTEAARTKFFETLITHIKTQPVDFPETRKKRNLEELPEAPVEPAKTMTPEEIQRSGRKDFQLTNILKIKLSSIMDPLRNRYKRFRKPIVDDHELLYLFEPQIAAAVTNPPFIRTPDDMIMDVSSGKKYFNMDLDVIEERLWNGFYLEPKQFLKDVRMIHADCVTTEDRDRILKASEMLTNVEVFIDELVLKDPQFIADCHDMYLRRKKEMQQRAADEALKQEVEKDQAEGELPLGKEILNDVGQPGDEQFRTNTTQLATAMAVDGSLSVEPVPGMNDLSLNPNSAELQDTPMPGPSSLIEPSVTGSGVDSVPGNSQLFNVGNGSANIDTTITESSYKPIDRLPNGINTHINISDSVGSLASAEQQLLGSQVSPRSKFSDIHVVAGVNNLNSMPITSAVQNSLPNSSIGSKLFSNAHALPSLAAVVPDPVATAANTTTTNAPSTVSDSSLTTNKDIKNETVDAKTSSTKSPAASRLPSPSPSPEPPLPDFIIPPSALSSFSKRLVSETEGLSIEQLEQLSSSLTDTVWHARLEWDKTELLESLLKKLTVILKAIRKQTNKSGERNPFFG